MSPTGIPDRRRFTVLLSLLGLWIGTAIVVLVLAVHSRSFHMRSWTGLWLSTLTAALVVLCGATLQQLGHDHDTPISRGSPGHHSLPPTVPGASDEVADAAVPIGDRLQIILDHLPTSFVLMDDERRILAASANFERITGRRLEQITGRHCTRALWSDGFCAGCPSEVAGRTGRPEREVVRVPGPDGTPRFLEHLSVPVVTHGAPSSILEVVTDITDRKSLQDGMAKAERLAVAGEMASVVTHEMRNSLTSVKMILQLLQEAGHEEGFSEELVGVALNSVHHAEGVLNELLQFAGPAPLRPQEFDPVHVVHEAVGLVRPHLDECRVDLRIETDDLVRARGDPEQLKTALLNLLLNASQAVRPEGKVVLRCRRERLESNLRDPTPVPRYEPRTAAMIGRPAPGPPTSPQSPPIVLAASSEVLRLEVEDSGPGVPDGLMDRIFDPFFTTKAKGTGLGLPMVKSIANAHHGMVTVRNLHPGCRFSIILPLVREGTA